MNSPLGWSRIFPEPIKLTPTPTLTREFYPAATSLEAIKLWKNRGSHSEGSDITVVASYVKDNLDRVFLGPAATRQGVTESVIEMWERVNTIYGDAR